MNGSAENFQIEAEAYLTSGWSILNTGKSQAPWNHDCFHHLLRTCWLPGGLHAESWSLRQPCDVDCFHYTGRDTETQEGSISPKHGSSRAGSGAQVCQAHIPPPMTALDTRRGHSLSTPYVQGMHFMPHGHVSQQRNRRER